MNLKDLINSAKDADVDVTKAPSFEEFKPKVGENYLVKVENVKGIVSKAGNPGLNFLLRIVDGPDGINQTIFESVYFTESMGPNLLARNLHYASLLGVDVDDIGTFDFPAEPGAKNGEDFPFTDTVAGLEPGYRKDKQDPTKEWSNHHYVAAASGPTTTVTSDDGDDDLGWDD